MRFVCRGTVSVAHVKVTFGDIFRKIVIVGIVVVVSVVSEYIKFCKKKQNTFTLCCVYVYYLCIFIVLLLYFILL